MKKKKKSGLISEQKNSLDSSLLFGVSVFLFSPFVLFFFISGRSKIVVVVLFFIFPDSLFFFFSITRNTFLFYPLDKRKFTVYSYFAPCCYYSALEPFFFPGSLVKLGQDEES